MSLDRYQQSLAVLNLPPKEIEWFPIWLGAYAGDRQVKKRIAPGGNIPVEQELVIGFLRNLRDNQVQAWQRLQATRAIEIYQTTVLRTSVVDFRPIRDKLTEIASRERCADGDQPYDPNLVAGEGMKDRVTVLADNVTPLLKEHLNTVQAMHESDLKDGFSHEPTRFGDYQPVRSIGIGMIDDTSHLWGQLE